MQLKNKYIYGGENPENVIDNANIANSLNSLNDKRLISDNLSKSEQLNSKSIYDSVNDADYGGSYNTLKGGCLTCSSKKNMSGGCFTCPKGQDKINIIIRQFSILIPKFYNQYKKTDKTKTYEKSKKPVIKPVIKPANVKAKKQAKKVYKGRGGLFDNWNGTYEWKPNINKSETLFSSSIFDINNLNFNSERKNKGIYEVNTTLSDFTSHLV